MNLKNQNDLHFRTNGGSMNNMEAAKKRRKGKCMQHVPFVLGVLMRRACRAAGQIHGAHTSSSRVSRPGPEVSRAQVD